MKEKIENFIKERYLIEWIVKDVKKSKEERPSWQGASRCTPNEGDKKRIDDINIKIVRDGIIRAIFGGSHIAGDLNNPMDRYAKEAKEPILTNALVMRLWIGSMNVHMVFIDNESDANILYYDIYKKMNLPDRDIEVWNIFFYGFGREVMKVKGTIRLSVMIGE